MSNIFYATIGDLYVIFGKASIHILCIRFNYFFIVKLYQLCIIFLAIRTCKCFLLPLLDWLSFNLFKGIICSLKVFLLLLRYSIILWSWQLLNWKSSWLSIPRARATGPYYHGHQNLLFIHDIGDWTHGLACAGKMLYYWAIYKPDFYFFKAGSC